MHYTQSIRFLLSIVLVWMVAIAAQANPMGLYAGASTGVLINTQDNGNSYRGVPLTLFAGYGGLTDPRFYLAGEVIGNLNTATWDNNGLKSTYSWGASVLPGIVMGDHLLGFVRLGILRNHFNWSTKTGAEVGAGLQTRLDREWDLRAEYDYLQFSGSLKTDQFAIGLVYKFL